MKKIILICLLIFCVSAVFAENYRVQSSLNPEIIVENERTLFILDFSNSMNEYLNTNKKIDIMLDTMRNILPKISPQKEVGMRAYGYRIGLTPFDSCKASKLFVPISKGGNVLISRQIEKTKAIGMTPITYSLKSALKTDCGTSAGARRPSGWKMPWPPTTAAPLPLPPSAPCWTSSPS